MKVLVVGGGGREHALVHAFASSPLQPQLFCAPGNAGIAKEAQCVPIGAESVDDLLRFALAEQIDLTVVGPEAPLVAGIADAFAGHGLLVFGPTAAAAQLEGSKAFTKEILNEAGAPTARFSSHTDAAEALAALDTHDSYPLVVKADGLAAGKGVFIAQNRDDARDAIQTNLVDRAFGDSSDTILIEEYLDGSEVSLLVLCDGTTAIPMAPAQDYKRIFAGDQGPNTGGMGSYCPVPGFDQQAIDHVMDVVVEPVLAALRRRGIDYRGVLYAGLIVTPEGVKVLEFNCRFGDPETQAILPRLRSDLLAACLAAAKGELAGTALDWYDESCVSVVMASRGYPATSSKGDVINGLGRAAGLPDVVVYHAGTKFEDVGAVGGGCCGGPDLPIVTNGGRVLAVSAIGGTFADARGLAYAGVAQISFDGAQSRADIAERAVRAERGEVSLFPQGWAAATLG